jgi:hypothetical protein
MVLEISQQTYRDLIGVMIDAGSFASQLIGNAVADYWNAKAKGLPALRFDLCTPFSMQFALTKASVSPVQCDSIQLDLKLGDSASKLAGITMQAGIDKDPSNTDWDIWRLNLKEKLANDTKIEILGTTIPKLNDSLKLLLRDRIKSIPILPIPVKPDNPNPAIINGSALKIVGDPTDPQTNALALLLVFGGGTQGDLAPSYINQLFDASFILPGESGRIAINFAWICRLIAPAIETMTGTLINFNNADNPQNLLGLTIYSGCAMNTQNPKVLVDKSGCKIQLTNFWLLQIDDKIQLTYELTIDLPTMNTTIYTQTLTLSVKLDPNGEIEAKLLPENSDPNMEQDLGWRIALDILSLGGNEAATALANALVGVAVQALVREITYGINWAINDKLKNAIKQLTNYVDKKAGAINNIPFDLDLKLKDLTIANGDILLGCELKAKEIMPLKVEGTFHTLTEGDCLNLDDGTNLGNATQNADLQLNWGQLTAQPRTKIAQITGTPFEQLYHYNLYQQTYDQTAIPINDYSNVYAVRTRQGRLSILKINPIPDTDYIIQYKTYNAQSLFHQWDSLVAFLAMLI